MGKKYKSFADWRAQENVSEYSFYYRRFKRLLLSLFQWENLPDGISSRFIEEKLFYHGFLIFFKSSGGFYRVSQANVLKENEYEEPIIFKAYNSNIVLNVDERFIKAEECVVIYNDILRIGNSDNVNFFAKKLCNIEKTIDCDLEHLKHPYIISVPEGKIEEVKRMINKAVNGEPYIVEKNGGYSSNNFDYSFFNAGAPNNISDLQDTKHEYINEALTFFGVNNVNVLKKERLTSGESEQNNQEIMLNRSAMLQTRKKACEEINKKFNLKINVTVSENAFSEIMSFYNLFDTSKKENE